MAEIQSIRQIKRTGKSFGFFASIFLKSLKIIFRSDRKIKMIHASFSNKKLHNSTLIKFRFRNALWYEFENVNTDKREFSIPKTGFLERRTLIVHGLFASKKYILTFDETLQFEKRIKFCQAAENIEIYNENPAYASGLLIRN